MHSSTLIIRYVILAAVLLAGAVAANETEAIAVGRVLDDFHDAAAHGDRSRYLGHMTEDGVFLGTDEWERWPKNPDFADYVASRFKDGSGWNYRSVERNVQFSSASDIAWFDEVVFSDTNGRFRGTGVLVRQDGTWKIASYAMSFLVFNENWEKVIELNKAVDKQKQQSQPD